MNLLPLHPSELDQTRVLHLLSVLSRQVRRGEPVVSRTGLALERDGAFRRVAADAADFWIDPEEESGFATNAALPREVSELLRLFMPLCVRASPRRLALAHLGQSLDGQIATATGSSRYVTGREDLEHVHRLRALCDAVVVGASTVERDDPQLTTRLVPGLNPTRVVIDPTLRVPRERRVFSDFAAPTCVVCERGRAERARLPSHVELIELPALRGGGISPRALVAALAERGLNWLLIEGGGVTVSRFIQARALDRLHLAVSPVLVGSGRPGLSLPPIQEMEQAARPPARQFTLGPDVLFDCRLDSAGPSDGECSVG